jgi:hypothetical protein
MASNRRYRAALVALPCSYCPDGNQARLDGSSCTDRANTGRAVEGSTDKRATDRANTGRAVEGGGMHRPCEHRSCGRRKHRQARHRPCEHRSCGRRRRCSCRKHLCKSTTSNPPSALGSQAFKVFCLPLKGFTHPLIPPRGHRPQRHDSLSAGRALQHH